MSDKDLLQKARELDEMTKDVTSDEADALEAVLGAFKGGKRPKKVDAEAVTAMYAKYLAPSDEDEDAPEDEKDVSDEEFVE